MTIYARAGDFTVKVMHLPYTYYPDPVGGTEIYVETLVRDLAQLGVENLVAAPSDNNARYIYDDILVIRYDHGGPVSDVAELAGSGSKVAAKNIADILDTEQPDIVHMHAFTYAVSRLIVNEAKKRRIPTVLTYHTPTITCGRGTLLRWGNIVCDGHMELRRCSACILNKHMIPRPIGHAMSFIPVGFGNLLEKWGYRGGVWTALRQPSLSQMSQEKTRKLLAEVEAIVVLCTWVEDVLTINDVDPKKLIMSRHGLANVPETLPPTDSKTLNISEKIRLVYLGRLHPTKGVDKIIKAIKSVPHANITLDIYGSQNNDYYHKLMRLCADDQRIQFSKPIPNSEIIPLLKAYDALVVPSQWLETGPLVVLEAFAAGIPIVGSRLGGIAEIATHGQDGLLVDPYDNIAAWRDALLELLDPQVRERLTANIQLPRRSTEVATDMIELYQRLLRSEN